MYILNSYPSFRVLVPLIAGILLQKICNGYFITLCCTPLLWVATTLVVILCLCYRFNLHIMFGIGVNLLICTAGFTLSLYKTQISEFKWPVSDNGKAVQAKYMACVTDYPVPKKKSNMVQVRILHNTTQKCGVLLYFSVNDSTVLQLEPADTICFTAAVQEPQQFTPKFDYKAFLSRQGIYGTAYIPQGKWQLCGRHTNRTEAEYLFKEVRHALASDYDTWGIKDKELAVLKALTLADKTALDQTVKDTYSHSGASHVLAVSGLHVGILYFLLSLLIPIVRRPKWLSWIREFIILLLLWCYACMIGLPFSITRSLIMFTFLSVTRILERDSNSINTLCFAALVILLANPQALFDSGLQLSFAAVFSILYFQPKIAILWTPKNVIVKYFYDIITVSIAAQIGTAPFIAYYFGGISILFLLTNIVVIPLVYLSLMAVMVTWIFKSIPWILLCGTVADATAHIAGWLLHIVNSTLEWISGIEWNYVEIGINRFSTVIMLYCMLFGICVWLWNKKIKALIFSMSALTILLIITLPFWHNF